MSEADATPNVNDGHVELNWNPPKVSRAAKVPEEEWKRHRIWIIGLHQYGSTLEQIMSVMRYHSIQEGTLFNPTRKQYVSRLQKWVLRRYCLHESDKVASTAATAHTRKTDDSSDDSVTSLGSLRYHQSMCQWCERVLFDHCAIQKNLQLLVKLGTLSEEEAHWKCNLADFYLAANDPDDARTLYVELLYRMDRSSRLSRLAIVIKLLQSSKHVKEVRKSINTLACLLDEDILGMAGDAVSVMPLVRGIMCQTPSGFDLTCRHCQSATELCPEANDGFPGKGDPITWRAEFEVMSHLRRKKNKLHALEAPDLPYRCLALLQREALQTLLEWCLRQVEGSDYHSMLTSSFPKPWAEAPDCTSFNDFENTLLFCFLWQKFRDVQKKQLEKGPVHDEEIVSLVEKLEQSLEIPSAVIFATVSTMRARADAAIYYSKRDRIPFYLANWAASSLRELYRLGVGSLPVASHGGTDLFFKAHEEHTSFNSNIEETYAQERFRILTQEYVRACAGATFPPNTFSLCLGGPEACEACEFPKTSMTRMSRLPSEENAVVGGPAATSTRSNSPAVRPESASSLTVHKFHQRPESAASVDMLATARSSLTSSKASLRSFQQLGRVAELLFKRRGDSGPHQSPSEVMDRDSHSSWSLRRLTRISYLSARSGMTVDGLPDEDTIMEEASL